MVERISITLPKKTLDVLDDYVTIRQIADKKVSRSSVIVEVLDKSVPVISS